MAFWRLLGIVLAVLTVLATTQVTRADDITFSGDVTYRERMALPAGAQLWVTLVAQPEGKRIAGAAAALPPGAQVPFGFVLDVRSHLLKPGTTYALEAEITAGGRTLFRSAPVPVDASAPTAIAILTHYAPGPAAPSTSQPAEAPVASPAASPLLDTTWTATSIGGDPVRPGTQVTLIIDPDLRAGGHGGCNSYFAETELDGDSLAFGPVAGTKMACEEAVMAQEIRFLAALAATASYAVDGKSLQLRDAAGVTLAGFVRAP